MLPIQERSIRYLGVAIIINRSRLSHCIRRISEHCFRIFSIGEQFGIYCNTFCGVTSFIDTDKAICQFEHIIPKVVLKLNGEK